MSKTRKRVYAHVKQDRLILESAEDASVWSGSDDVSNIDTNTSHREGTVSMSFDKDGTTEAFGQISKTLDTDARQLDLSDYLRGQLRMWINLSALTDVANVQLIIGEDATDNYVYQVADSDLSAGWNEVTFNVDSPTSTGGAGAAWSSISYIAVRVTLDGAGDTLTEILVDAISVQYESNVNIENINLSGTGLASAANQSSGLTKLTAIQSAVDDIDTVVYDESAVAGAADPGIGVLYEAEDPTSMAAVTEGDYARPKSDLAGRTVTTPGTLQAGEDLTNDVQKVEGQFSYQAIVAADTQVKASSGFLHSVTISCDDAAPTAGSIIIYDNSAESGTEVWNHTFTTTPFAPFTCVLDYVMGTGIYIGFTTTADVNVTLSYR